MVTELPLEALSPAAGSCLATTPVSLVLEYVVSSTYQNPAADSSALSAAAVTPARSGDFTPESIFQIAWPANPAATMAKMVTATFIPHASRLRPEGSPGAGVRLPLSALHMTAPRAFPASPPLAFVEDRAPVGTRGRQTETAARSRPAPRGRSQAPPAGYLVGLLGDDEQHRAARGHHDAGVRDDLDHRARRLPRPAFLLEHDAEADSVDLLGRQRRVHAVDVGHGHGAGRWARRSRRRRRPARDDDAHRRTVVHPGPRRRILADHVAGGHGGAGLG